MRAEEKLLHDAVASSAELYAALRTGDVATAGVHGHQVALAAALADAAAARTAAAAALAVAVGLPADGLTLSALAAKLPEPWAAEVTAARDRLTTVTAELMSLQRRNANLARNLRSFFRGALAALITGSGPVRYGPSGACLTPAAGPAVVTHG